MADATLNPSRKISRRSLLRHASAAFAAGGAVILGATLPARAKTAQAAAGYQNSPKGAASCGNCKNFKPPSSCQLVDGEISPSGWCKFYVKKS